MKPRIVLYNPRSSPSGKKILPLSLMALGAVLEGLYEYSIVDGNVSSDPLQEIRDQAGRGADVLAVTVMPGPQLSQAYPHCVTLKKELPGLMIVWGGYFPTLHASACLNSPAVDIVVCGYGELTFLELLNLREHNGDWRALPGLTWRDGNGAAVENPPAMIPNPDDLPAYPYHRMDMARYVRNTCLGSRTLSHHSSYGCPFLCNFCAVVNMVNGRWLAQSATRVAKTVELLVHRWQANAIEFHDNNFFTSETRVAEVAEQIAPLHISWWGEARIDTLLKYSDKTWKLMRDAGLKMVFMGAESASMETMKRMAKGGTMTPEKTLAIAAKTKEYGIVPEFSFIVGNPPDPEADLNSNIRFIRQIKKVNPKSEIILYTYSPVPLDGDLYHAAQEDGFHFPDTLEDWVNPYWLQFASQRHTQAPWLDRSLRRRIRNFERVLNAYYPTSTDPRLDAPRRALLRAAGSWRYYTRLYGFPLELRALQKLFRYQRPETTGF
jgi:anaerobic magnesium-protoporphyrin IX monomethyl ester cyclase